MTTVMVVDDHGRVREALSRLLAAEGHRVVEAANGLEALHKLGTVPVHLVLLDLVMPETNGLQLLSALRELGRTVPVIVLSAVEDVATRVQALDLGAVDYVAKPFNTQELLARVRRHLAISSSTREGAPAGAPSSSRYLIAAGIDLDLDRHRARYGQEWVDLAERECTLLAHLMRRNGQVCNREELLHDVWHLEFDPGTNLIEVCVRRLRSKLPGIPIQTVRSVGYCLEES
ncbi:response regulator transcription factor [Nocardioides sp.]|uniref:response regulator transcription factor n=1 Tax=Nocardioides sp. TaxID=35761 RepID=UPI0025FA5B54|nr:response regulator transcription factor [Nocardioides sp.]